MEVPMAMGRPKAVLVLDAELREQLESLANSRSLPAGLVRRAKIILLSASGKTNVEIARQLETSKVTVSLWRCRFLRQGVSGLYDELRPGRPRQISDERVAQLVRKTLKTKPKAGTHWSIRQIADETGVSKSTVHRIWQAFGLLPYRSIRKKPRQEFEKMGSGNVRDSVPADEPGRCTFRRFCKETIYVFNVLGKQMDPPAVL
jgi:putative transposase